MLREAEQLLGLSRSAKIHIEYLDDAWGEYIGTTKPHVIHLHNDMKHTDANFTLWHELVHAMQCERDFGGKSNAFNQYWLDYGIEHKILDVDGEYLCNPNQLGYGLWLKRYDTMPSEREANVLAHKYSRTRKIITKS